MSLPCYLPLLEGWCDCPQAVEDALAIGCPFLDTLPFILSFRAACAYLAQAVLYALLFCCGLTALELVATPAPEL